MKTTLRPLAPEAADIFQKVIQPNEQQADYIDAEKDEPDGSTSYITYGTTDNFGKDHGGNVLETTQYINLDVPPEVLLTLATKIIETKNALEGIGFITQKANIDANFYLMHAYKLVAIENLRDELLNLAQLLGFEVGQT